MARIIPHLASPAHTPFPARTPSPTRRPSLPGIEDLRCGRTPSTHEARQSIEEHSKGLRLEQERIDAEQERIDAELNRLHAEQERINTEQERIDAELRRLHAELQRLSTQRQDVTRELEINQALLAPVHRLFPELLSEVFMHAIQNSRPCTKFAVRVLCSVCTTWRATARDTPSLWTSIDLEFTDRINDHILYLQLELSRQLSLKVLGWRLYPSRLAAEQRVVFDGLSDADASRVEEIEVAGDGDLLSLLRLRKLPTLQVATVEVLDYCAPNALGFLASAPVLRSLSMLIVYQCVDNDVISGFPVPTLPTFPCVTRLQLFIANDFPVSAFFPALSKLAPSLRDLKIIAGEVAGWDETKPAIPCEMPVLRTVELQHYSHILLTYITAPALKDVTLHGDGLHPGEQDPTESLLDLLSRSRPSLRSFSLDDAMQGSADTLLKCIDRMEGLQRLSMEDNEYYGMADSPRMVTVLKELVCDENRPPILPELRSLSVHFQRGHPRMHPDIAAPLSQVRLSRKVPRVCAGRVVVAME
ncbi:hypothetical protein BD626DRAFT_464481 [Schizophyllum amplum]|uniref:F-box domain-containing protein n=1 Tax=Schizophyllum amplum TaxID=97359 RepID=A0A550BZ74_9AGAR|nr:hypothetical protein BD626DRAFT_464481 [Auriculariopsis ampla]